MVVVDTCENEDVAMCMASMHARLGVDLCILDLATFGTTSTLDHTV
jgi:hypothetical protein